MRWGDIFLGELTDGAADHLVVVGQLEDHIPWSGGSGSTGYESRGGSGRESTFQDTTCRADNYSEVLRAMADMDARARYRRALVDLLDDYGVEAESRYVAAGGPVDSIHYLDAGETGDNRSPVLCLHGNGTPASDWVPLLPMLADRRVIVPERPGHGLTPPTTYDPGTFAAVNRSLLVELLDSLGVDAVTVVGNSFGGYHALSLAANVPERVERLVLAGAPAGVDPRPPMVVRLFGVPGLNRLWYRLSLPGDTGAARTIYRRLNVADASGLSTSFLEAYLASTSVPGRRRTLLSQFEDVVGLRGFSDSFLLGSRLESVTVPTRLVWGDTDFFGDQSLGRRIADPLPDAEFVGIEDAGHMPWLEPGDAGRRAIVEFI